MELRLGFSKWVGFQWVGYPNVPIQRAGREQRQPRKQAWMMLREVGEELSPRRVQAGSPKPFLKVQQPLTSQGEYQVRGQSRDPRGCSVMGRGGGEVGFEPGQRGFSQHLQQERMRLV